MLFGLTNDNWGLQKLMFQVIIESTEEIRRLNEGVLRMKRAEQLEKTRTAILNTARKLFLKKGYQGTSTRDIANQIGITQPALYHHFSDKEVIFLEVISQVGSEVRNGVNKVMRKSDLDPIERLMQITQVLTKLHPNSVFSLIHLSDRELKPSSQRKLEMIFKMDYLDPISEFFKLPEVRLRPEILPNEAAGLYISSLSPAFTKFHRIGGEGMNDIAQNKLLLKFIMYGISKGE